MIKYKNLKFFLNKYFYIELSFFLCCLFLFLVFFKISISINFITSIFGLTGFLFSITFVLINFIYQPTKEYLDKTTKELIKLSENLPELFKKTKNIKNNINFYRKRLYILILTFTFLLLTLITSLYLVIFNPFVINLSFISVSMPYVFKNDIYNILEIITLNSFCFSIINLIIFIFNIIYYLGSDFIYLDDSMLNLSNLTKKLCGTIRGNFNSVKKIENIFKKNRQMIGNYFNSQFPTLQNDEIDKIIQSILQIGTILQEYLLKKNENEQNELTKNLMKILSLNSIRKYLTWIDMQRICELLNFDKELMDLWMELIMLPKKLN